MLQCICVGVLPLSTTGISYTAIDEFHQTLVGYIVVATNELIRF